MFIEVCLTLFLSYRSKRGQLQKSVGGTFPKSEACLKIAQKGLKTRFCQNFAEAPSLARVFRILPQV